MIVVDFFQFVTMLYINWKINVKIIACLTCQPVNHTECWFLSIELQKTFNTYYIFSKFAIPWNNSDIFFK